MAISYQEQTALGKDPVFQSRVQAACLKFADYIQLEAQNVPAHTSRMRWSAAVVQQPYAESLKVSNVVVGDAAVVEAGADITDTALQGAVETCVQSKFI